MDSCAPCLRSSLRRKSFITETRRARSFGFYRRFSVISVSLWLIFISMGGPQAHVTLRMTPYLIIIY